MYAPVFLPPAPEPSPDVLAAERAILDAEGPYCVDGRYYSRSSDADQQRRLAAGRRVREAARQDARTGRTADGDRDLPRPAVHPVRPAVATWLTPRERTRLDAAKADDLVLRHHDALGAVRADLARGVADGALVSAARLQPTDVLDVTTLVRGFPGAPVVALVNDTDDAHALASVLLLGRAGVRQVVDTRTPRGWCALRDALCAEDLPDAFRRHAVASVLAEIGESEIAGSRCDAADVTPSVLPGCARFFALAFAPRLGSAKAIASDLGVHPTTLCSRFVRAGLPSPKRYATAARLVLVARFAERPGVSFGDLACRLGASSAQSLGRAIRTAMGLRASAFRAAFDGEAMLRQFRASLVTPYRDRLRAFDPTAGDVAPSGVETAFRIERAARPGKAA